MQRTGKTRVHQWEGGHGLHSDTPTPYSRCHHQRSSGSGTSLRRANGSAEKAVFKAGTELHVRACRAAPKSKGYTQAVGTHRARTRDRL